MNNKTEHRWLRSRINRHFLTIRGGYRRLLSIGASALISISTFLTIFPQMSVPVYAAGTGKSLQLGYSVIGQSVNTTSAATVYFGSKGDPLSWRVIGYNGSGVASSSNSGKATLLASNNIGTSMFNEESSNKNVYAGSTLQSAVNNIHTGRFKNYESNIISERTLAKGDYSASAPYCDGVESIAVGTKLWPLSTQEAYYTNEELRKASVFWWLRSPGFSDDRAAGVISNGNLDYTGHTVNVSGGVRPAFNINLSSIILTSAAEGGKNPGTGGAGTLKEVAAYSGTAWKLTLHDTSRDGDGKFTASAKSGATLSQTEGYTSWTVPVTYSGAQTGTNEHVSAILTNSAGTALYYGYIATNSAASGEDGVDVTIPTGLSVGTYKLKIFNEQVNGTNGNYATDLSSAFHDITLTVTEAQEQVATPTFSPTEGTYTEAQNVTISCTTNGATIHYTTDGTTPTTSSPTYSSPINVSETKTIKAIAVKTGMTNSSVASATYTINIPGTVATPTFSPAAGTYATAQNVTISCSTDGATIHYTTDGSTPTDASSTYNGPINISETKTIKAIAVKDGMTDSSVASARYTISDTPVDTCTITFERNGGKGDMDDQTVNKGVRTQLNKNKFTRSGYSFNGWNTRANGSGTGYEDRDYVTVNDNTTLYAQWKKGKPKHDDDEETEEPSKPAVVNPDTVEGYFAVNGQPVPGVAMGKTVQGVAAQAVFNATRPAGFLQAFTFNMAVNGKVDYTLKNGVLTIIIPKEFRKAGRTFAIMALDKNGKAWTFADTDNNPNTVTATINVEGYAFALIYKD